LWLVVVALLGVVWWLASERNQRRYSWAPEGNVLVVSKGRFFPTGTGSIGADDARLGKVYGPIPLPQGAKVSEQDFDDQTSLDRALFDLVLPWSKDAVKKGDEQSIASANALVDRLSALPGLSAEQHGQLTAVRGELSFTAAKQDLLQAAKLVLSARRKLETVRETGGDHALEAGPMLRELEGIQGLLEDSAQGKQPPAQRPAPPVASTPSSPAPAQGQAAPSGTPPAKAPPPPPPTDKQSATAPTPR
jgi:hypothetical protein